MKLTYLILALLFIVGCSSEMTLPSEDLRPLDEDPFLQYSSYYTDCIDWCFGNEGTYHEVTIHSNRVFTETWNGNIDLQEVISEEAMQRLRNLTNNIMEDINPIMRNSAFFLDYDENGTEVIYLSHRVCENRFTARYTISDGEEKTRFTSCGFKSGPGDFSKLNYEVHVALID